MKIKLPFIALLTVGIFLYSVSPIFATLRSQSMPESPNNLHEKYQTDLFSGTASYSYPLNIPKGTNDLTPNISFTYNSGGVRSIDRSAGSGWQLSRDYIERDTNFTPGWAGGTQDDKFKLHFQGMTYDLIYVASESRYHTKTESFLNIQKLTGGQNDKSDYWQVITKDGTKYRFGYLSNSELLCDGKNHVFNQNRDYILRWNLDEVTDIHNNHIYYTYTETNGTSYLNKIEYNTEKKRSINFNYATNPYQQPIYYLGCKMHDVSRLENVQAKVDTNLVRQYDLAFASDSARQPLLTSVTEKGSNGSSTLPATTFDYKAQNKSWSSQMVKWIDNLELDAHLDTPDVTVADVNGDALLDIVRSLHHGGPMVSYRVYLNQGTTWNTQYELWVNNADLEDARLDRSDTRFLDVTGDFLPDIVKSDNINGGRSTWKVNRNTGSSWNTTEETWINNEEINAHLNMPNVVIADVNGDNLADIVKSYKDGANRDNWIVFKNGGNGWNNAAETWLNIQDDIQLDHADTKLMDINGDNLPDIVKSGTSTWYVWKNTGDSFETTAEQWLANSNAGADLSEETITTSDVNGDGLLDVIKIIDNGPSDEWKVLLNKGNDLSTTWETLVPQSANVDADAIGEDNVKVVDVDGDSLPDILRTEPNGGRSTWIVWKNNGKSPDLLSTITTAQGGKISFDYIPSTKFDNTGSDSIFDLPFSMWLVEKMTKNNGLTNTQGTDDITTYSYQDGFYKWQDKEFRGFSTVDELLPSTAKNKYVFNQDDALKGMLAEQQTRDDQNNPYKEIENTWGSSQANGIYTVKLNQQKNYTYDGSATNPKITQVDYLYDNYGNITKESQQGDTGSTGDERFTYFEYVYNTTAWILEKTKHTYKHASDDTTKVSESWFYYDSNTGLDDTPTKGDLTKEVKWINTTGATNATTLYEYDTYGNLTETTDVNNHSTQFDFGTTDTTHTYPDSTTNAKSQTISTVYDLGTGSLLSKTDPNNLTTSYTYDVFGRIAKEITPYDNENQPTVSYEYFNDGTPPESTLVSKREVSSSSATLDAYTYIDGLERQIQTRSEAEETGKQIVVDTFYDPSGEIAKETVPYLGTSSTSYVTPVTGIRNTEFAYDPLNRIITVDNPKGDTSTMAYDHWKVTEIDEAGKIKRQFLNAYDKVIKVEEVNGANTYTTNYTYNARDDLTQITDNSANNFTFIYDSLSRKTSQTDPDLGEWLFEYDGVGNLIEKIDNRDVVTTQTYDQLNRILSVNYPTDTDISYTYDGNGKVGTLTSVTDAAGTLTYTYDNRLRKTQEQRVIDGTTMTTQYTYDALDRIASKTNPDNTVIDYVFNNQGEIENVTGVVSDIDYNAQGKITKKDFANSLTTDYTYNTDDFRLSRIQTGSAFDSSYTYDEVGNILNITDNLLSKTQYFGYDDLERLTSASESAGFDFQYEYNDIGNLTKFISEEETIDYAYGQNAGIHALTSSTEEGNTPAPPVSNKLYTIYGDALSSGWQDWSWSSTNNLADTSHPYIGENNISWQVNSGWAGLNLHKDGGTDTTGYNYLTIAIRASESGQVAPQITLIDENDQLIDSIVQLADYGGDPVVDKYKVYSIPLSALGGSNRVINNIIVQDITGSSQPTMYIDSIALTGVSAAAAFTGEYFNNQNLSGTPNITRQDSSINFDWANGSYETSNPVDHYSVRWTKTESFIAGDYEFSVTADDGIRLYIDNELIIDKWVDQPETTYTADKAITGGTHDIRIEYYENGGGAIARFNYVKLHSASFHVYDEELRSQWYNWSWSSNVDFSATTSANTRTKHINWEPQAQWAGLHFHTDNGITTSDYTHLSFAIQATKPSQSIEVLLLDEQNNDIGTPLSLTNYGGNPVIGSYTVYSVPLDDLGGEDRVIKGFYIKDASGNSTNEIYVDSVKLIYSDP